MQEEVESRTVNLAISTSKLTARTIVSAVRGYLNHRKNVTIKKEQTADKEPSGKQSVKELLGQGQESPISISPKRICEGLNESLGSTVSTMPSGRMPPLIRPSIWFFSRQRTPTPWKRHSRSFLRRL